MTGDQLRDLRLYNKLTQLELSELLGISSSHISKIENGHKPISRRVAMGLLTHFEMTPGFLEALRRYHNFFTNN